MFDIQGARQEGYNDEEIAQYLAQKYNFSTKGALTEGYSHSEILEHLSQKETLESTQREFPITPIVPKDYGLRADGTPKGPGFLGELKRPDGKVSTELSIGVRGRFSSFEPHGEGHMLERDIEIPSLIPTLSQDEINYLLKGGKPTKEIVDKAIAHANKRMAQRKSPFKEWGEGEPSQGLAVGYGPGVKAASVESLTDKLQRMGREAYQKIAGAAAGEQGPGETIRSLGTVYGPVEAAANLVSQAFGVPAIGIAEIIKAAGGPEWLPEKVGEATVYQPRTKAGQQLAEAGAYPWAKLQQVSEDIADYIREKTGSPLAATAVGTIAEALGILGLGKAISKGVPVRPGKLAPKALEWPKGEPFIDRGVPIPPELERPALPPGQGFVLKEPPMEGVLRKAPAAREPEIFVKKPDGTYTPGFWNEEMGRYVTPLEEAVPEAKGLPPGQGFVTKPTPPKTILRPEEYKPKGMGPEYIPGGETREIPPENIAKLRERLAKPPEVAPPLPPNLPGDVLRYAGEIRELRDVVQKGEPGKRVGLETGETASWSSSYPPFMADKGWTKIQVLQAIDKGMKGEKLGARQQQIWDAARKEARGIFRDRIGEQKKERLSPIKTGELEVGDRVKVKGEVLEVKEKDANKIIVKDDQEYQLDPYFDTITGRKLTPKKGTPAEAEPILSPTAKDQFALPGIKQGLEMKAAKEGAPPTLEGTPLAEAARKAEIENVQPSLKGILKSEKGAIQFPVEEIKRAARRFREFWQPFSTLPQKKELLKARGEAFGKMARADRIVDKTVKLTKDLPDQAKRDIFETIDMARKDINTLPPEQQAIAKEFITVNNLIGKMLVERNLIGEEAYRNLKGQYIKYAYLKHHLGENVEIPISASGKINTNALKARKGLTLEQQKSIGFIEDVSIAQPLGMAQSLSNIVKYDYLEKLAQDPRNVWTPSIINIADMPRKYSESIAKAQATRLSRITGDRHASVKIGNDWQIKNLQTNEFVAKKIGIGELNEEVELYKRMYKANPNSPEIKQKLDIYQKYLDQSKAATQNVPEDFIQMPTAKSWGPLAGTFIRKEVARDLMSFYGKERGNIQGLTKAIDSLVEIDQMATGLFKIGKVPLNLPTVIRNTVSNPIQLNMSGMNFADIIKNMVRTGEDFINKPPTYTKASRNGLFKTNWSVTEINEVMDQFRNLKGDTFADVVGGIKNLSKYYGRIDDFFKYTKLLDGLDNGLSFDKAIIEAQKWVMDYSLADPSIKWARKHFVPFASYSYKIAPLVAESVVKRPWVIGKYMALPAAMMALAKEIYKDEMTEDDWKALKKTIPEEVTRKQSFLLVPWKIKDKFYWFDYSYFLPWGNYMNAISGVSGGDIKAPLVQFGIGGTPTLTVLKTFTSAAMRDDPPKDSFSGYPLYNRLDEPIDKALKTSEYFYNLFAPSMVTRYGALGYTLDIGKEDRYGRVVPAEQAIAKWFGVNLDEADPKLAAIVKKGKINALKDEYLKIMIDPKYSEKEREKYAKRFKEEIDKLIGKD